jgi:methylated-DNA-[protein]-cysteine S-methyltransferase
MTARESTRSAPDSTRALGTREALRYPDPVRLAYHVMSAPPPLGLLFLARTERGLRYTEFMDRKSIRRMIQRHEADCPDAKWEASLLELKAVVDQFESYFCGTLTEFDLALDPVGTEFQQAVWNQLRQIPYARTRTYGQIAKAIGQPKAARAVGLANHDNPIAIIVPCHRVIGADGGLVGYGGGVPRKRWLLQHEARFGLMEDQLDLRPAMMGPAPRVAVVAKPAYVGKTAVAKPTPPAKRAPAAKPVPVAKRATVSKPAPSTRGATISVNAQAARRSTPSIKATAAARSTSASRASARGATRRGR